jgi:hypothetical protein
MQQKMLQFSDDTYGEERSDEKLFRFILKKYKKIARSIKSLLDFSTMSIEEVIGHLKVVDGDEPQPLSGPITVGGSYISLGNTGRPAKVTGRRGSPLPRRAAVSVASYTRCT